MKGFREKLGNIIITAKTYWHTPPKGNHIPYKEVAMLGFGGFGAQWVLLLSSTIGLNAGNFILGACFEIHPTHLQYMLIIANLIGIPLGLFRSYLFDNARFKGGKFLPFLKYCAAPTVLLAIAFVWLPYEHMTYMQKVIAVEIMYLVMTQFHSFYYDAFYSLQQIISPNTQERVNTLSITQIIYSLAPSISNFLIPTVAGLTYGNADIRTYRLIYPVFTLVGLVFNHFCFRGVKERIVLPKEKQAHIRLVDAIREVSKNKYFWIINLAGWLGFLEGAGGVVLYWTFVYGNNGENEAMLGLVNTLIGNGALFSMILAPFFIGRFGKRNMLIGTNVINVILLTALFFGFKNPIYTVVIIYLNNFVSCFYNIYYPGINADIRDYHQYKTGVRVDSMFGVVGILGTFIGFGTGMVVPAIYEKMGLVDDYSVLYNDEIRNNLLSVLIIASAIGAVINVIPFFFYDLTEEKHRGYVKVLKIRAMLADYVAGRLSDDELVEVVEIIHLTRRCDGMEKLPVPKEALKQAKKLPKNSEEEKQYRAEQIKSAKAEIKRIRSLNDDIGNTPIVIEELNKYSTERYLQMLNRANETIACGKGCVYDNIKEMRAEAKAMPKTSAVEKEIRSDIFAEIRAKKAASEIIRKHFADGLVAPDESKLDGLSSAEGKSLRHVIADKAEISRITKRKSLYDRAIKPYTDAIRLVETARNYTFLDEIEEKYNQIMAARGESV